MKSKNLKSKTVKYKNWELEYLQFIDDYGIKFDMYVVVETLPNGNRLNRPYQVPFKIQDYNALAPINDTNEPTKKEMLRHLKEFIQSL
jgi:hypothetical protein